MSYTQPTQPLSTQVSGIAKSDGTVVLTFPAPPTSLVWTGTISVPNSPPGAQWSASVMGIAWGSWSGQVGFGPVQAVAGASLQVTGQGLTPGTPVTASWQGTSEDAQSAATVGPSASSSPTNEVVLLPITAITANLVSTTQINVPAGADVHALGLGVLGPTAGNVFGIRVQIVGLQTGINYLDQRILANAGVSDTHFIIIPFASALDQEFNLVVTATGGPASASFVITGYTAAIPAYTPPLIPSNVAFAGAGPGGTTNILPVNADGRQYLITNIHAFLLNISTTFFAGVAENATATPWMLLGSSSNPGQDTFSIQFPFGVQVPTLYVINTSNVVGSSINVSVVYTFV